MLQLSHLTRNLLKIEGRKTLKNNVYKLDIFKIALILIIVSTILICTTDDASAVNTGAETGYNAINVQSSQVSADSNSVDIDEENSESAKIKLTNEFREGYSPQFPDPRNCD